MKHSHYHKNVKHLEAIDVYRVLQLFGVTDPCLQHAVKKLLCAGQRGVKPIAKDVQEAIDSLTRWQEMLAEDAVFIQERIDNAPLAPASIQWPESEERIDVIGQNGNDGAAYGAKEAREKVQTTNLKLPDGKVAVLVSDPDNMRPEGATHWHEEIASWLQLRGQEYWFWMGNMWVFHAYKRYADGKNIFAIVQPSK